jgi:hypothetical protein
MALPSTPVANKALNAPAKQKGRPRKSKPGDAAAAHTSQENPVTPAPPVAAVATPSVQASRETIPCAPCIPLAPVGQLELEQAQVQIRDLQGKLNSMKRARWNTNAT